MNVTARTLTPNQQARRQRILSAARALVAEKGYDGMVMRDVAAQARVSPTTLYNLYNTKDELLLEALRESIDESLDHTADEVPAPGFERLMAQLRVSARQTLEEPAYARAITRALLRANPGDQIIEELCVRTGRAAAASLASMIAAKQLDPDVDIHALAMALVSSFWGVYAFWSQGLIELDDLHRELRRGYLSLLLPVVRDPLAREVERQLLRLPQ